MEKRKLKKAAFNIYQDNSTKILPKTSSRKSMFIPKKLNFNNNFENNKNDENEINSNNINNNENYNSFREKYREEIVKNKKRGSTRKPINILKSSLLRRALRNSKIINKDYVFSFLSINSNSRKEADITAVAKYLSKNYQYFTNLKNNDSQMKVEKLAKIIKLEIFPPDVNIIRYGDMADKFYIVLEGYVEVYKPIYESIFVTNNEFIKILKDIKYFEKDENKYLRVKDYNKERNFDISDYENISPDMDFMNVKANFYIEKLEKLGKYGEGYSFGEMALINNCQRNATIKTVGEKDDKIILLSIDKESYNQAIKEYQEKKISKEVDLYLNNYPFISHFSKEKILRIFNCMKEIKLEKDDYLFHQNDKDENLYFILNGNFEISLEICFPWLNDFIDYIFSMKENILTYLSFKKPKKLSELYEIIEKIKNKQIKSPMIFNKLYLWEKVESKKNENNLIGLKTDEEKLNRNNNIYKLHIKNVEIPILLGIEDAFEYKNKFYTVKCLSPKATIKSIKVIDFIKIIFNFQDDELNELLEMILKSKTILKNQIIDRVKYLSNTIINKLEYRYENLLHSERITKKERDIKDNANERNKIISLIKMKGYKNGIQDILDAPVDFLSDEQEKNIYKMKRNIKSSNVVYEIEDLINNKKNQKNKNDRFKNNKNNLLIIKNLLRTHKTNKHLLKFNKKELNLNNCLFNKSLSNKTILQSLSDIKIKNNYSTINTNIETYMGSNTFNNILNKAKNLKKNNNANSINEKNREILSQNSKEHKINKKLLKNKIFTKNNSSFHKSKSNKNNSKFPLSFKKFIHKKIQPYTYRDYLLSQKIIPINSDTSSNLLKDSSIKNNYKNNTSEIHINDKTFSLNYSEIEKNFLDSKNRINKDNSQFGYLDDNKDFYLCDGFSKKFKQIFNLNIKKKKYNFPLISKRNTNKDIK